MDNNRKKIGIVLIVLGLLIIALIIYFGFIKKDKDKDEPIITETPMVELPLPAGDDLTNPGDISRSWQPNLSAEAEHVFNETDLKKRAKAFAERFGSYSNQSNYSNFSDLEIFMTKSFADWAKSYVEQLRESAPSYEVYYGISTRALTTELISFNEITGQAEVNVLTERSESSADGGDLEPYQQKILLKFNKLANDWLVDAAYWEKR